MNQGLSCVRVKSVFILCKDFIDNAVISTFTIRSMLYSMPVKSVFFINEIFHGFLNVSYLFISTTGTWIGQATAHLLGWGQNSHISHYGKFIFSFREMIYLRHVCNVWKGHKVQKSLGLTLVFHFIPISSISNRITAPQL